MLYFRGCTARERLNSISISTEKLLKLAKVDFKTLDNEECCGSVLLRTGFEDDAKEQMKKNLDKFKDETIIVSCAGCYNTLKNDYNELLGVQLDVIHISQLLLELIKENRYEYNNNIDNTNTNNSNNSNNNNNNTNTNNNNNNNNNNSDEIVTYHDPCHLGRHSGEFDAPREVIKHFSHLKEMENIRENSKCCGSGGGVKSAFPEIAKSIATERGKEAENTGCDVLVTSCPFCKLNLDENSSLEVLDLSEFVLNHIQKEDSNKKNKKLESF
ncbi:(Fe-S)-binding protein [Methanobrevibacter sp. TMH8]|uniref:(Fe-S)-binding protein n=1 Tax=Methanobrevibacter sp. TMH8 TaxID=2848611 RepID=UPI001CCA7AEE|nr:(Fe-S)-binding protein [Methanobrevibacter sp. TMH8]MBZ9571026.1 (Fe-S)-binding protein [Methanobrevibacter sp. TMH8]